MSKLWQDALIAFVQGGVCLRAKALQLLRARQNALGSSQLVIFTSPQSGFLKLANLEAKKVEPCRLLALVDLQTRQLVAQLAPRHKRCGDPSPFGIKVRIRINQIEMAVWVQEDLMFVLSVQLYERRGGLLERGR
jgi:hypothetical protein